METTCEASLTWERQERFARLCPLLKRNAAGQLRCSVDTPDVRPFWGRAFAFLGGGIFGTYLIGFLAVFIFLRTVGYEVSAWTIAWPPAWRQIHAVRSQYFTKKARQALAAKNVNEAVMSLSYAYQLDPQNYAAGFTLAQLWQTGQPALADRVYSQLLHDHAAKRPATLTAWYQSLLLRGDFRAITAVAADALRIDPEHANAWIHALLFALRREPDPNALQKLADDSSLPIGVRSILALERDTAPPGDATKRALLLREPIGETFAYRDYYRPRRLIQLGYASDALGLIERDGSRIGNRDQLDLQLEAYAALGWKTVARNRIEGLFATAWNSISVEVVSTFLIRHPDAELLGLVFDEIKRQPLPQTEANYSAYLSLLCAAGVGGDFVHFKEMVAIARKIAGADFRTLGTVEDFFRDPAPTRRIEPYLPPLQPLPVEVNYALLERYYRPRTTTLTTTR